MEGDRLVPLADVSPAIADQWDSKTLSVGGGYGAFSANVIGRVVDVPGQPEKWEGLGLGLTASPTYTTTGTAGSTTDMYGLGLVGVEYRFTDSIAAFRAVRQKVAVEGDTAVISASSAHASSWARSAATMARVSELIARGRLSRTRPSAPSRAKSTSSVPVGPGAKSDMRSPWHTRQRAKGGQRGSGQRCAKASFISWGSKSLLSLVQK